MRSCGIAVVMGIAHTLGHRVALLAVVLGACSGHGDGDGKKSKSGGGGELLGAATLGIITSPPSVGAPAFLASEKVGSIPAGGGVSDGSFSYSLPIAVQTGRAGMQPSVSLVYSSHGGNGLLGVGWSVTGASSITRCKRRNAMAGRLSESVRFTLSDRLCLDGQLLVLVAGTYGALNSEYRTEIESYTKIVITGFEAIVGFPPDPTTFEVSYRDGRIGTYTRQISQRLGLNNDGSLGHAENRPLRWTLDTLRDRSGNGMKYTYTQSATTDGMPILDKIEYTTCVTTPCQYPGSRRRKVQFTYENRAATDTLEGYVSGVRTVVTKRLKSVATATEATAGAGDYANVFRYDLTYIQGGITGRTLLRDVALCDSNNDCLPKTSFTYGGESAGSGYTSQATNAAQTISPRLARLIPSDRNYDFGPENSIRVFDANGDGNDDVIYKEWPSSTIDPNDPTKAPKDYVALSDGNHHFLPPVEIDPDGDGVSKSGCTGSEVMDPASAQAVDLDGDGRMELVAALNSGCPFCNAGNERFQPGNTAGVGTSCSFDRTYGVLAWDRSKGTLTKVTLAMPDAGMLLSNVNWTATAALAADMNGDGLPDLLRGTYLTGGAPPSGSYWDVALAVPSVRSPSLWPQVAYTGTRVRVPIVAEPLTDNGNYRPQTFHPEDEDGDGRADFVQADYAGIRRSFRFNADFTRVEFIKRVVTGTQTGGTGESSPVTAPVAPNPTNWGTPVWNTSTFGSGSPEGYWKLVDVNGDGLDDVLFATSYLPNSPWKIRINTGLGLKPAADVGPATVALQAYVKDVALVLFTKPFLIQQVRKGLDNGMRIADMNGDGRDDLVLLDPVADSGTLTLDANNYHTSTAQIRIAYSNGSGFDAPVNIGPTNVNRIWRRHQSSQNTQLGDINGDGIPEIIDMVRDATDSTRRRLVALYRDVPRGGVDLLQAVSDEFGQAQAILYDSLSAGTGNRHGSLDMPDTHISDLNTSSPIVACRFPARCVSKGAVVRRFEDYRSASTVAIDFTYRGARSDITGRGWLGFTQTTDWDRTSNLRVVRTYDPAALISTDAVAGNGTGYVLYPNMAVPSTVRTIYVSGGTPAGGLTVPTTIPLTVTSSTVDYTGYPLRPTRIANSVNVYENSETTANRRYNYATTIGIDAFGNEQWRTTLSRHVGSALASDYRTNTDSVYDNVTSSWLIGQLRRRTETATTLDDIYGVGCPPATAAPCSASTRVTEYEYTNGLLTKVIREPAALTADPKLTLTTVFHRDGAGLTTSVDVIPASSADGPTRTSSLVYDESGINVKQTTNAAGHKAWFFFQPLTGWLYASADQNGGSSVPDVLLQHDRFGRVRKANHEDGSETTYNYAAGIVREADTGGQSRATFIDPRGRQQYFAWTTFDGKSAVAETVYDALGAVSQTRYSSSTQTLASLTASFSSVASVSNGGLQTSAAVHDALGRVVSTAEGLNEISTISYPAPLGTRLHVDPAGYRHQTFVDQNGRIRTLTETLVSTTGGADRNLVTRYAYQEFGKLVRITLPDNSKEMLSSDLLGRDMTRGQLSADGLYSVISYSNEYTSFNELAVERRGGAVGTPMTEIRYKRDALGRVTERKDATVATNPETQTITWDVGAIGKLNEQTTTGPSARFRHVTSYAYDPIGRFKSSTERFSTETGGEVLSFGATYDSRGRLETLRYPETASTDSFTHPQTTGLTLRYTYRNGELEFIRDESKPPTDPAIWQAQERHALGFVQKARNSQGLTTRWARDPNTLRPSSIDVSSDTASGLATQAFTYNTRGLLGQRTVAGKPETFSYDSLGRLYFYMRNGPPSVVSQGLTSTIAYNDVGDITGLTTSSEISDWPNVNETYSYGTATFPNGATGTMPNFLTSQTAGTTTTTFSPDGVGRLAKQSVGGVLQRQYTYTTYDLPRTISLPTTNKTVTFNYSADGMRVRKTTTGGTSTTDVVYVGGLYEQQKTITGSEFTGASVFRVAGDGNVIAEIVHPWTRLTAGTRTTTFVTNDHQNSPAFLTNGSTVTKAGFYPFGKKQAAPPATPLLSSLGYTGHEHDDELGLVNMRGRIYDLNQRRFITRDPVLMPFATGGANPYAYAQNDPLNMVDRTGFWSAPGEGPPVKEHDSDQECIAVCIKLSDDDKARLKKFFNDAGEWVEDAATAVRNAPGKVADEGVGFIRRLLRLFSGGRREPSRNPQAGTGNWDQARPAQAAANATSRAEKARKDTLSRQAAQQAAAARRQAIPAKVPFDPLVDTMLPKSGPGYVGHLEGDKRWGRAETIDLLENLGELWEADHPGYRLVIGSISNPGGGPMPKGNGKFHDSHMTGEDVDIQVINTADDETLWRTVHVGDANYDRAETQHLIDLIILLGGKNVKMIGTADKGLTGKPVLFWGDHDKHIHLRLGD